LGAAIPQEDAEPDPTSYQALLGRTQEPAATTSAPANNRAAMVAAAKRIASRNIRGSL
jgi:hypothetical protein